MNNYKKEILSRMKKKSSFIMDMDSEDYRSAYYSIAQDLSDTIENVKAAISLAVKNRYKSSPDKQHEIDNFIDNLKADIRQAEKNLGELVQ